jgi:ABC-type Na+ efflux pump permease subunit
VMQFLAAAALTPPYVGGAIAEEKERKTLEFILATDLRNREIILGKLLARLGNVLLILLMGVPVVAFLQFLGGIDPLVVIVGFLATGVTITGLAGLSILNSVYARKPRTAIIMTYLEVAAYLLLSTLIPFMLSLTPVLVWRLPGFNGLLVVDLFTWMDAGNPITVLIEQGRDMAAGVPLADSLPGRLRDYALFHLLLALGCIAWASARLRVVFRKQVYGTNLQRGPSVRRRPRVGRWPMAWKEVIAERGLRFNWFGWLILTVLVIGSFLPLLFIAGAPRSVDQWGFIAGWARLMGGIVACLLLLRVAVHASTSVSSERDRQTLDGLLTTPLSSTAILFGKWLGSCASVRWGWLWLAVIWGLGVVSGGLHPLALLLLLFAWSIYAATLAVLGLWFSLVSASSLRATVLTLLTALGMGMSYVMSLAIVGLTPYLNMFDNWVTDLLRFQQGMSPLVSLSRLLPFYSGMDNKGWWGKGDWEMPMGLLGLGIWAVVGLSMWLALLYRFRQLTSRQVVRVPENPAGAQAPDGEASMATATG